MALPNASAEGFDRAVEITAEFGRDLLDEAGRIAKRVSAQEASPEHVEIAGSRIYQGRRAVNRQFLIGAGGLLAGIFSSAFVDLLLEQQKNEWAIAITAFLTLVTVVVTVLGFRD